MRYGYGKGLKWCGDLYFVKSETPKKWWLVRDTNYSLGPVGLGFTAYHEGGAFEFEGVADIDKQQILTYFSKNSDRLPDNPEVVWEHWRG